MKRKAKQKKTIVTVEASEVAPSSLSAKNISVNPPSPGTVIQYPAKEKEVAVVAVQPSAPMIPAEMYTQDKIELIKRTICKGASDDELALFIGVAKRTGLDAFAKQIHAVFRYDKKQNRQVMSIQIAIDGFRLIAERTGQYQGQAEPEWCGEDGQWRTVWLDKSPPRAARIGVYRTGFRQALYAVALWDEYVQTFYDKSNNSSYVSTMWKKMPTIMLSKVAEALALRKAFPQDLSGMYTPDEIAQADNGGPMMPDRPLSIHKETYDPKTDRYIQPLDSDINGQPINSGKTEATSEIKDDAKNPLTSEPEKDYSINPVKTHPLYGKPWHTMDTVTLQNALTKYFDKPTCPFSDKDKYISAIEFVLSERESEKGK